MSHRQWIITTVAVVLAIGATFAASRIDLLSPLLFESTPTPVPLISDVANHRDVASNPMGNAIGNEKLGGGGNPEPRANRQPDRLPPTFDAIRIDPDGTSVFAGHGPPGTRVTILANGEVIATIQPDDQGQWAISLDRRFAAGKYQFSLVPETGESGQPISMQVASADKPSTDAVPSPAVGHAKLPEPIKFLYDQATFTDQGRTQAELFAEFLRMHGVLTATLTGHADERGTDFYNLRLSQQRLDTVARYLRGAGFSGKLVLIPMGRSEPFTTADRQHLSSEQAFAFDRRVEMKEIK